MNVSGEDRLVFVSYSHEDKEVASSLADFIETTLGPDDRVWIDRQLGPGAEIQSSVEAVIAELTDAVCVVSPSYIASRWCQQERSFILDKMMTSDRDRRVIPYLLPGVEMGDLPPSLRARKAVRHCPEDPMVSFRELVSGLEPSAAPVAVEPPEAGTSRVLLPRRPFFVGREKEMAEVLESLEHPRYFLTNIVGRPGIGKTTLAQEAMYRSLEKGTFETAVYVSADGADLSLRNLEVTVLELLKGHPVREQVDYNQQALELLASRPVLLVIDNFETIDRDREGISSFLIHLPSPSKALITSREFERALGPAPVAVDEMREEDAEALLVAEWARLNPGKQMPFDPRVVYQGAGGNPHLMTLVLGELKSGGVLEHELERLAKAKGKEFGYYELLWRDKLDRNARVILQSLAIFATPAHWEPLRAASGLSGDRLRSAINGLVERCLVGASDLVAEASRTWKLHPEIRYFAQKKLRKAPAQRNRLLRRFADHFLGITKKDSRRSWSDYSSLKKEQENIFAAMEYLTELRDWQNLREIIMRVRHFVLRQERVALVPPNRMNEYFAQARNVCEKGLAAAIQSPRNVEDECRLLLELGTIEIMRRDLETAEVHLDRCVERCRETGNTKREIMALRRLGHVEARQGNSDEARKLYTDSRRVAQGISDDIGISRALRALGDLAFKEERLDRAEEFYRDSLETINGELDWVGMPRVVRRIGNILYRNGRLDEAARQFEQVIELYLQKPDLSGCCYSLYALGRIQEERAVAGDRALMVDGLRCALGCLRALAFVHQDLWLAVSSDQTPAGSPKVPAKKRGLETYIPPVDTIIDHCFDAISRVQRFIGEGEFRERKHAIVRELSVWEGEWLDLIRDVVGQCNIPGGATGSDLNSAAP